MSIFFIIPNLRIGGTEKYLISLSNFLIQQEWKVTVLILSSNVDQEQLGRFSRNIKVVIYPKRILNIFGLRRFILSSIEHEPCIVYGLLDLGNLALILIPSNRNFVKISSLRYSTKRLRLKFARKLLIFMSILKSQILITNSNTIEVNRIIRKFTPTFVIPNGVKLDNSFTRINNIKNNINILVVANLRKEKGLIYLLKAIANLDSKQKKFFCLKIVGEGVEREKLSKFIEINKLNVRLEGKQFNVEDYYKWADIYFQPSVSEGFSNSILEAMSYSLPVFASNTGAAREVLETDGVIFESKNVQQIKNLLLKIYDGNVDLNLLGSLNKSKIGDKYQIEHCLEMHVNILRKLSRN